MIIYQSFVCKHLQCNFLKNQKHILKPSGFETHLLISTSSSLKDEKIHPLKYIFFSNSSMEVHNYILNLYYSNCTFIYQIHILKNETEYELA